MSLLVNGTSAKEKQLGSSLGDLCSCAQSAVSSSSMLADFSTASSKQRGGLRGKSAQSTVTDTEWGGLGTGSVRYMMGSKVTLTCEQ